MDFRGIYPALMSTFGKDGTFDFAMLRKLVARLAGKGVRGFYIGGSSSELFSLTLDERKRVMETVRDEAGSGFAVIAHVGAVSTDEAVRYALAAKKYGARHIAATPPFYYGFVGAQVAKYFYDISLAADMPVMIYNFPVNTGKALDLNDPDIRGLLKSGAVFGVKHTNINVHQMERIRRINPGLVMMNGYDETMTAGLAFGADGSIGSTFNVMLPHYLKIYNSYRAGDAELALTLQAEANDIMDAFCSVGLIAAIKYALVRQGIEAGEPRRPFTPLTDMQKKLIEKAGF